VLWATTARFAPNPAGAVHAFCHAVPDTWHQMGVILSAASSLSWLAGLLGASEAELLATLGDARRGPSPVLFLPYLGGERTPHNDPHVRGVFLGLAHETDRADLVQAVLEGVAFAFRDCLEALRAAGTSIATADVVGGGARSRAWIAILADVLGIPLNRVADAQSGAASGAARVARIAATGESVSDVCRPLEIVETIEPDVGRVVAYAERFTAYSAVYPLAANVLAPRG
jgi:xylulokinase